MKNKLVLAFSGGQDSTVLLWHAASRGYKEIHTLSFDYGQRHRRELDCVVKQISNIKKMYPNLVVTNKVIDVSYIKAISPTSSLTNSDIDNPNIHEMAGDAQPVSYVPFRNQMFLSICCAYAESLSAETVWYGAAEVDSLGGYWDCSREFLNCINETISLNRMNRIVIEAPLLEMSKAKITQLGVKLGVNFAETWTCYSDREDGLADATTPSSSLRLSGFVSGGYRDPIKYIQQDRIEELYTLNKCVDIL